jgi:hypothetical protein
MCVYLPGSVFSADVSSILQAQGYWASYNRPWFSDVYTQMGYAQLVRMHTCHQRISTTCGVCAPAWPVADSFVRVVFRVRRACQNVTYGPYLFGYSRYFRGEMFAREQVNIHALLDMQRVMSLNKWQTDVLSRNNSGFAISSRFDLSTYDPVPSLGFFYRGAWGAYGQSLPPTHHTTCTQ